jgi:hypothetical protein
MCVHGGKEKVKKWDHDIDGEEGDRAREKYRGREREQ